MWWGLSDSICNGIVIWLLYLSSDSCWKGLKKWKDMIVGRWTIGHATNLILWQIASYIKSKWDFWALWERWIYCWRAANLIITWHSGCSYGRPSWHFGRRSSKLLSARGRQTREAACAVICIFISEKLCLDQLPNANIPALKTYIWVLLWDSAWWQRIVSKGFIGLHL